jgi:hypothetical protein
VFAVEILLNFDALLLLRDESVTKNGS